MSIARMTKAGAAQVIKRSLFDFSRVREPRRKSSILYPLSSLLTLVTMGFAAGKKTLRDIETFAVDLPRPIRRWLGLGSTRTPCDTTIYNLIKKLNPSGLRWTVIDSVKKALRDKKILNDLLLWGVVVFDGKGSTDDRGSAPNEYSRETVSDDSMRPHWFLYVLRAHLVSSSARPCLDQIFLDGKTGETTGFRELLPRVASLFPKLFQIVMGDAEFLSRANAQLVISLKKFYVFALKANRMRLYKLAVETLRNQPIVAWSEERYQGYFYRRELRRAPCPDNVNVPGAKEFWLVTQTKLDDDGTILHTKLRYFVTSLEWNAKASDRILLLVRLHWGIENNGNWTMDTQFDDDVRCPCKHGYGAVVINWLRVLAYNLTAITRSRLPKHDKLPPSWRRVKSLIEQALTRYGEVALEGL